MARFAKYRFLKYVRITDREQAKRMAQSLERGGITGISIRKTKDPHSPYHVYGKRRQ